MLTVRFLGRVLPAVAEISVGHDPTIKWESPDIGLIAEFKNRIEKSQIDIQCVLNRHNPDDFVHLYMRALDLCRASVELVSFARGWGLFVVLDTFIDPNGIVTPIVCKDDSFPPLCTEFSLDSGFDDIHTMVLTDWRLGMALNDLIQAISVPHVSVVNCARAIEGLRHLIASLDADDKQAWQQMRQALQVDRAYLELITATSTNSRHGNRVHVPGAITTEITRRTWIIMNRYFAYRKRASTNLSPPEFPLLTG